MTNEELRAAAERLRNADTAYELYDDHDECWMSLQKFEDIQLLADAMCEHLATHRPDDDETDSIVGATILSVGSDNSLLLDGPCGRRRRVWMLEKIQEDCDLISPVIEAKDAEIERLHEVYAESVDELITIMKPLAEAVGKPVTKHNYPVLTGACAVEDLPREVVAIALAEIKRLQKQVKHLDELLEFFLDLADRGLVTAAEIEKGRRISNHNLREVLPGDE